MELENIDIIDGATVSPLESIAEFGNLSPIPEDPDGIDIFQDTPEFMNLICKHILICLKV